MKNLQTWQLTVSTGHTPQRRNSYELQNNLSAFDFSLGSKSSLGNSTRMQNIPKEISVQKSHSRQLLWTLKNNLLTSMLCAKSMICSSRLAIFWFSESHRLLYPFNRSYSMQQRQSLLYHRQEKGSTWPRGWIFRAILLHESFFLKAEDGIRDARIGTSYTLIDAKR